MASLKCREILCLVYSGILFISGLILIAFSVVLTYRVIYHFSFVSSNVLGPLILLFLLGIIHLFLTWLGIKGPPRENNVQILMFIVFTIILLVCELTIGIWSLVIRDEQGIESIDLMTKSFNADEIQRGYKKNWSKLQSELKCCGLHGSLDFGTNCPVACINHDISNGNLTICYENGCQKPLVNYIRGILLEAAIIGFLAGVYQILGLAVFITFFKTLREERAERLARRVAMQRQMSQSQPGPPSAETPLVRTYPDVGSKPTTPPVSAPPPPVSAPS